MNHGIVKSSTYIKAKLSKSMTRKTVKDNHKMAARAVHSFLWVSSTAMSDLEFVSRPLAGALLASVSLSSSSRPRRRRRRHMADMLSIHCAAVGHDPPQQNTTQNEEPLLRTEPRLWSTLKLDDMRVIVLRLFKAAQISTIFCFYQSVSHSFSTEEDSTLLLLE